MNREVRSPKGEGSTNEERRIKPVAKKNRKPGAAMEGGTAGKSLKKEGGGKDRGKQKKTAHSLGFSKAHFGRRQKRSKK